MPWFDFNQIGTKTIIYIVIILVILLILFWYAKTRNTEKSSKELMTGMWAADKDYCDEADLDEMILYIGPRISFSNWRTIYILAKSGGNTIINESCNAKITPDFGYSGNWSSKIKFGSKRKYTMSFDKLETKQIPETISMVFMPGIGKIILEDPEKEEIKGVFYKDNASSEYGENTMQKNNNSTSSNNDDDEED